MGDTRLDSKNEPHGKLPTPHGPTEKRNLYDESEVHHAVDVDWSTMPRLAKCSDVTQFIEEMSADDLINTEQENTNDLINTKLQHQCIKATRQIQKTSKPYNFD